MKLSFPISVSRNSTTLNSLLKVGIQWTLFITIQENGLSRDTSRDILVDFLLARWSLQAMIKDYSNHSQSNKGNFEFTVFILTILSQEIFGNESA